MNDSKPFRGGRVFTDDDAPIEQPKVRKRYPCFADGCPMVGSIFPGAGVGGTGETPGSCAWHYGVNPTDIPKVTQVLRDWQVVSFEINEARRTLTGELAADPKALEERFAAAWDRLQPLVPGWETQLAPGNIHTSKGVDRGFREGYGDWAKRLERFLGARVVEVLSVHQRRAA